jgi:beta-lactamase regulating signal transducer with metallopeptidase domain
MNLTSALFSSPEAYRLGWVLLHSAWQFAIVAIVLRCALWMLRNHSANARYISSCLALATLVLISTCTFFVLSAAEANRISQTKPVQRQASSSPTAWRIGDTFTGEQLNRTPFFVEPVHSPDPGTDRASEKTTAVTWPAADKDVPMALSGLLAPGLPWIVTAWMLGVGYMFLSNLCAWIAVERMRRIGTSVAGGQLEERFTRLVTQMRVRRPVCLLQSALLEVPVVIGWLRPLILVPLSMVTLLPPTQIDAVLAHELAHICRRDYLINLLQTVIESLCFYHPAVWWISGRIRMEREHCCDDIAVATCESRIDFASALAALDQTRGKASVAMAATGYKKGGETMNRIRRVLGEARRDTNAGRGLFGLTMSVLLAVGIILCFWESGGAQATADVKALEEKTQESDAFRADPRVLFFDAGRGTLPLEQGFKFYNSHRKHKAAIIDGALQQTGTDDGYQFWFSNSLPLDFSPDSKGVAVEWVARVEFTTTYKEPATTVHSPYLGLPPASRLLELGEAGRLPPLSGFSPAVTGQVLPEGKPLHTGFAVQVWDQAGHRFLVYHDEDAIYLLNHGDDAEMVTYAMDTTDRFHHFRFAVDDGEGRLFVDGHPDPVLSRPVGKVEDRQYAEQVSFGDNNAGARAMVRIKTFFCTDDASAKSPFSPPVKKTESQPPVLFFDAARRTLPLAQGFNLLDTDRKSQLAIVDGALEQGTTEEAYQFWHSNTLPLDFSPDGNGVAVEWIARIERGTAHSTTKQDEVWTGFSVSLVDQAHHRFLIYVDEHVIYLQNGDIDPAKATYKMDTTDGFHHFRFVVDDGEGRLFVDGHPDPMMSRPVGGTREWKYYENVAFGDGNTAANANVQIKAFFCANDASIKSPYCPPATKQPVSTYASAAHQGQTADLAFDGDDRTWWGAGRAGRHWIEADLGKRVRLSGLTLSISQTDRLKTRHEVWVSDKAIAGDRSQAKLVHVFDAVTRDRQQLKVSFSGKVVGRYVQVLTSCSPGFPAWNEIEIHTGDSKPSSAN